jgi:hypothetical protein
MPIRPFLEGQVFEPELIEAMSKALIGACQALGLRPKDDAVTRLLALRIIKKARDGVHDAELLKAAALRGASPVIKH